MRITNKIMQNNSLSNINLAKVAEDARSSQVSSGKKIVRPSDDPIVAIRSLRLRSSVVEITQYYSRNAKDADAWLKTTEDAMQQVADVITDMITQYNKGANEYLTSEERNIILEQLKGLKNEVYATGDADYAGRYIFTGYRTESSLMFREAIKKTYQITEQFTAKDLRTDTFVNTSYEDKDAAGNPLGTYHDLRDLKEGNQSNYEDVDEDMIDKVDYHRIRLAYNNCDEVLGDKIPVIEYKNRDGDKVRIDGNGRTVAGAADPAGSAIQCMKSTDVPSPYQTITQNPNQVIYLYDTGELLLGDDVYKEMSDIVDDPLTSTENEGEIQISYQKTEFKEGDLKPEHYFYCIAAGENNVLDTTLGDKPATSTDDIVYNPKYLQHGYERQVIEYDVGYNQRLQVNTIAEECFNPDVNREVDDMIQALERMQKTEDVVNTLKGLLEKESDKGRQDILKKQLDAANKALTYERKVLQDKFSGGLTAMQGFLNEVNVAVTSCGARGSRLELVSSRLCSQKTTFETLKSENEDVDLSEAVVQLSSAERTYEAALKATGKIMQVNLMDFI